MRMSKINFNFFDIFPEIKCRYGIVTEAKNNCPLIKYVLFSFLSSISLSILIFDTKKIALSKIPANTAFENQVAYSFFSNVNCIRMGYKKYASIEMGALKECTGIWKNVRRI